MDISDVLASLALFVSILSLFVSWFALRRVKANTLFELRQRVLTQAEAVRTAWIGLSRENRSLVHRMQQTTDIPPQQKGMILEFLADHDKHLDQCLLDACAMAEDVQANGQDFDEKKCKHYLWQIEPSLEKLARNKGADEVRMKELLETLPPHLRTSP